MIAQCVYEALLPYVVSAGGCDTRVMATKQDLENWIIEVLARGGGSLHHVRVAEAIWKGFEDELRSSGDLLYTWQYDLRWAAQRLRDSGVLAPMHGRRDGIWRLAPRPLDPSAATSD